jgi:hypothetical protein
VMRAEVNSLSRNWWPQGFVGSSPTVFTCEDVAKLVTAPEYNRISDNLSASNF